MTRTTARRQTTGRAKMRQPGDDLDDVEVFDVTRRFAWQERRDTYDYRSKRYGWIPITIVNVYRLLELQKEVVRAGLEGRSLWRALDEEIKARIARGEIKVAANE